MSVYTTYKKACFIADFLSEVVGNGVRITFDPSLGHEEVGTLIYEVSIVPKRKLSKTELMRFGKDAVRVGEVVQKVSEKGIKVSAMSYYLDAHGGYPVEYLMEGITMLKEGLDPDDIVAWLINS